MRAIDHDHKGHGRGEPLGIVRLAHDERALRRRLLVLDTGDEVLVDLPKTVAFETGDVLVLETGGVVEIVAAEEDLHEVRGRDPAHLLSLAWHIGNRHLPAQIGLEGGEPGFLLITRDHVIAEMLEGLGAAVKEVRRPFSPLRGAYGDTGHHHHHHHSHG